MPVLHLGVIDVPYSQAPRSYRGKRVSGTQTTGDVAQWLENKYHVIEHFAELHGDEIAKAVEDSLEGALESLAMGGSFRVDPFAGGMSKIEDAFRMMLDAKELDGLAFPGIPTKAAERGVNHRLKRPNVRRAPRASFIDTGLYQASFRAWAGK